MITSKFKGFKILTLGVFQQLITINNHSRTILVQNQTYTICF